MFGSYSQSAHFGLLETELGNKNGTFEAAFVVLDKNNHLLCILAITISNQESN